MASACAKCDICSGRALKAQSKQQLRRDAFGKRRLTQRLSVQEQPESRQVRARESFPVQDSGRAELLGLNKHSRTFHQQLQEAGSEAPFVRKSS